jgi:hypothetical protein
MKATRTLKRGFAKSKLPKHIRENIKHPLLRQAWIVELATASHRLARSVSY